MGSCLSSDQHATASHRSKNVSHHDTEDIRRAPDNVDDSHRPFVEYYLTHAVPHSMDPETEALQKEMEAWGRALHAADYGAATAT